MEDRKLQIISARKLPQKWITHAKDVGISLQDFDFLQITPKDPSSFENLLLSHSCPLVLTSKHAIHAIAPLVHLLPNKNVYVIEGETSNIAEKAGLHIMGTGNNAAELIRKLKLDKPESVLHCTTSNRIPTLSKQLPNYKINYHLVEVYDKILKPQKVENYDGILFYSPSQIDSFLLANELIPHKPMFCMGSTTANHLKKRNHHPILTAKRPTIADLMELMLKYYKL